MWMAEYKDITELKKQIADFKKAVHSPNGDYLTGYVCALSATEGIIAGLPDADVVEVVRCKDCKSWEQYNACNGTKPHRCMSPDAIFYKRTAPDDFCSYGKRKEA